MERPRRRLRGLPRGAAGRGRGRRREPAPRRRRERRPRPTRPAAATTARPRATPAPPADQRRARSATTAMSSRGAGWTPSAAPTAWSTISCGSARGAAQHLGEVLGPPHPVGRAGLGEPVRVEHDRVAGAQLARAVVQLRPVDEAEQRARRAELLDRAVGAQDRRQRVPAAGDGRARGRAREVEVQAGDRAEAADQLGVSWRSIASPSRRRIAAGERRRTAAARIV